MIPAIHLLREVVLLIPVPHRRRVWLGAVHHIALAVLIVVVEVPGPIVAHRPGAGVLRIVQQYSKTPCGRNSGLRNLALEIPKFLTNFKELTGWNYTSSLVHIRNLFS